jgi:hypothetical protein
LIQDLIDTSLSEKQSLRDKKDPSGYISPSGFGGCFRKQYWQRKGEVKSNPIDARTLRMFQCGNLFHDFVQQFLPVHQVEVPCEVDDVRGRADIVTADTVYDIKSQHSKSFFYMNKEGYDVKKEKYGNWLQLACYAQILKKPNIVLVIISKDDLCIAEYHDETNQWNDAVARELAVIRGIWDKKELPEAEARAFKSECSYCNYLDKCKEIGGKQWISKKL